MLAKCSSVIERNRRDGEGEGWGRGGGFYAEVRVPCSLAVWIG